MYLKIEYRYLLFCVFCTGWILSSCSSDVPAKIDKGAEVSFAVPDVSRASTTTSIDRFAVYGDMNFMEETTSSPTMIFDNTEVIKTDNGWGYQGTQYWVPNHEYTFVAIHPLSVLDDAQYADSKLSFTYTLPNSNDDAADIIAATHRRLYREADAVSSVSLRFGHLLSLISFTVELDESSKENVSSLKIHELVVSGFGTSAVINIKPAPRDLNNQTDDSEIDFATVPGNGSLEINFAEPPEVIDGGLLASLIMLPQSFQGGEEMKVSLTYSVDNETETVNVSATKSDFKWETGMSYNYKINLKTEPKEANLTIGNATINPWAPPTDQGQFDVF